jgi:hypothetical protein
VIESPDSGSRLKLATALWLAMPFSSAAARLLATAPDALQADVTGLLVTLKVETDDRVFASWVVDANRSPDVRIAALRLLNSRQFSELPRYHRHVADFGQRKPAFRSSRSAG